MKVHLEYGTEGLELEVPSPHVQVITPRFVPGLVDEAAAFRAAVRDPIGGKPLRETVRAGERVAIVIADITRPLPSERLLPWIFAELSHVPAEHITVVNGTGSHRVQTPDELAQMVGADVARRYRVVNHDAHDASTLVEVGKSLDGHPVRLARAYVEADRRIVLGFIEPHFMAGFSGGYKGVFPAVADIASIMHYHRAAVIGDARSTWGNLDANPTQEQIRHAGSLLPVDFLVNLTLNRRREITAFFCGAVLAAHARGCAFARETAMVACDRSFPVVVTTNAGYPLDQNLYQTVKGMSAGAQVVQEGGFILTASRCNDGFPTHGNYKKLLFDHASPRALLDTILTPGFSLYDQWEAQLHAIITLKARVGLHSALPPQEVRRAFLEPVDDPSARISAELAKLGADAAVAVLPEGPMTIPYLA
ncbi:MAG: nickel-dependent lactate racemase [Myxococcaceae bacterium]